MKKKIYVCLALLIILLAGLAPTIEYYLLKYYFSFTAESVYKYQGMRLLSFLLTLMIAGIIAYKIGIRDLVYQKGNSGTSHFTARLAMCCMILASIYMNPITGYPDYVTIAYDSEHTLYVDPAGDIIKLDHDEYFYHWDDNPFLKYSRYTMNLCENVLFMQLDEEDRRTGSSVSIRYCSVRNQEDLKKALGLSRDSKFWTAHTHNFFNKFMHKNYEVVKEILIDETAVHNLSLLRSRAVSELSLPMEKLGFHFIDIVIIVE